MELGLGVLSWPPEVFWRATLPELMRGLDGWMLACGMKPEDRHEPLDQAAFEVLKGKLDR